MSSAPNFDGKLELAEKLLALIRATVDESNDKRGASEQTDDFSVFALRHEGSKGRANPAFDRQGFTVCGKEPLEDVLAKTPEAPRYTNACDALSDEDRHEVAAAYETGKISIEQNPNKARRRTAGSALKSILRKHHARLKSGHDRILDLHDV